MLATANPEEVQAPAPLMNISQFPKLSRLFRCTAAVFKIVSRWRHRDESDSDHMAAAQRYWIGQMQKEMFTEELKFLKTPADKRTKAVPRMVNDLNLFLDSHDLIRSKGRINKTLFFSEEVKNPLLLAKEHPLTKLIIKDAHERCKHLGMPTTVSFLRNAGYWVPKARRVTRSVPASCAIC